MDEDRRAAARDQARLAALRAAWRTRRARRGSIAQLALTVRAPARNPAIAQQCARLTAAHRHLRSVADAAHHHGHRARACAPVAQTAEPPVPPAFDVTTSAQRAADPRARRELCHSRARHRSDRHRYPASQGTQDQCPAHRHAPTPNPHAAQTLTEPQSRALRHTTAPVWHARAPRGRIASTARRPR